VSCRPPPEGSNVIHRRARPRAGLPGSLSITPLAAVVTRPARFIGAHLFNPMPMLSLLELIRGLQQTSDEMHARALAFTKAIGKTPITVKNRPVSSSPRTGADEMALSVLYQQGRQTSHAPVHDPL